jgi:broad specificity phosphatase PhoE
MAIAPVAFWFLRHGETEWNARSLSQGSVDIPLNPRGIAQAEAAAKALKGRGIATIIHSPLGRARHTAEIVAAELGLPVAEDEDLRESAFGTHEGQPMGDWFAEWVHGRFTPPGGEPFPALRLRAVAAVNRALGEPPSVLLVGHGAFWRAVRSAIGLEVNVRTPNATPLFVRPPASGAGAWTLEVHPPG